MSVTTKKKHVERELYEDFSLPQEHQSIVRVLKPCGNNLHQVFIINLVSLAFHNYFKSYEMWVGLCINSRVGSKYMYLEFKMLLVLVLRHKVLEKYQVH